MPYGNINVDTVTTSTTGGILGAGNASIMKNRIINGAMIVAQRGTGSTSVQTSTSYASCDRWASYATQNSKYTIQQSSTSPTGFGNSLLITSSAATSLGASDYFIINQPIEGNNFYDLNWGTANAKTVTLSFQVYSSLTGTFGGSLTNYAGNRSYPFTYTISTANTWTTASVTIAGDTSGTWVGASNAGTVILYFSLGTGTTFSGTAGAWASANYVSATGATSVVGTNGATFYITGVQLEVGSSATGFEYRQYGQELALCQRYYQKGFGNITGAVFSNGTYPCMAASCKVTMRTAPTVTLSANCVINFFGIRTETLALASYTSSDGDGFQPTFGPAGNTYTLGQPASNTSSNILASAEL